MEKRNQSPAGTSTAKDLAVQGKIIFDKISAPCHGTKGEGKVGPAIMGPKANLPKYKTAKELLQFISEEMPMDNPGGLKPEEYLAVMSYLLLENKLINAETNMSAANLDKIVLKK